MRRLFSLVVPTYNVERYLGDFLDSLAAQTYPIDGIEIVFVDDGSTDSSAEIITKWIAAVAPTARVVHKENGGLSSARNSGLDRVGSRWVTFTDPDDKLSPNYFSGVAKFLAKHDAEDIHLVACRLLRFDDLAQKPSDTHPLRFRFTKEYRVVDLERHPQHVHLSAASAFYRTDLIEQRQLRFDHRVQPNFEDGHFTGLYLADHERPRVAFLRDPVYHYRRRAGSLVQTSWTTPEKFTEVPRYGYLDLLEQVDAKRGAVPVWLQNLVLYDLLWYFKYDERDDSPLGSVADDAAGVFHEVLPQILRHIDTATIKKYRITSASTEIRNSLIIAKGERLRPSRLRIERVDRDERIAEIRYCYGGELPREEFQRRGLATRPVYEKCRSLSFVGKRIASERIVWLPTRDSVQVTIDDRTMRIRRWSAPDDMDWYRALRWRAALVRRRILRQAARVRGLAFQLRTTGFRGGQYRNAWVFANRHRLAGDNAEHLYRYVKVNHPEINAWFVVDRDTKDWLRLEQEGFRVVEYGTAEHCVLMLNCVELISSQVDDSAVKRLNIEGFGKRCKRFTLMQHAVTKDDFSRRLNRQPIDRLIAATEAEHQSIAGDGTPYVLTDKEVQLTGFPRHDRLLRLSECPHVLAADPLLLVMPTWRRQLVADARPPGGARVAHPGFFESPYATNWLELLHSERLSELAERAGLSIAFVPHPNSTEFLTRPLPDHVETYRYQDVDIQELFARGAVMITDYSSNAFELAYLNRPVIYFQFDPEDFYSGQHVYRRGQWNYEADGFGPVVERPSQVLDELASLVDREMKPAEPYAGRMAQAFAFRDGCCCARVFESIQSMRRPPVRTLKQGPTGSSTVTNS